MYETDDDPVATTPVGRIHTGLNSYQVHLGDSRGTLRLDHCSAIGAVVSGTLSLGSSIGRSVLSGGAAYLYRSQDLQLLLTRDELGRLICRELLPAEYLKLRKKYGIFFEIEDSFYEPSSGRALQPIRAAGALPA